MLLHEGLERTRAPAKSVNGCWNCHNWRALRVINETDDFQFVQWDENYIFDGPATGIQPATIMPGVNIDGTPIVHPCGPNPVVAGSEADPLQCKALCANTTGCLGWVLHQNSNDPEEPAPGWRCCLKQTIEKLERSALIVSETIQALPAPKLVRPDAYERVATYSAPALLPPRAAAV